MAHLPQFAVLQKDAAAPSPDQLKRVFKAFTHLTDADAVRVALGARGLLMRQLGRDAARALQRAFQEEGVAVAIVAERDLPGLPEGRSLHRLGIWPQAFAVYDLRGRTSPIEWQDISLVAAGAVHQESGKAPDRGAASRAPAREEWPKRSKGTGRSSEGEPQLWLEILLNDGVTRYQLDAAKFTFRYVIDRPGLALEEKFIWMVKEIGRQCTRAILNFGARSLVEGQETVPFYMNRQVFNDELIWLMWRKAGERSGGR